jgi:F-type H+-transporting ATPase subunit epsilon
MSKQITLEIVTPDRKVISKEVDYVGCPGVAGEFGVLPNHIPFLSALGIGNLYYKVEGKPHFVFVAGGFAEVGPEKVTILAEVAEIAAEIDLERARKAQERAEERMRMHQEEIDFARARAAMQRALARLRARSAAENQGTLAL